VTAEQTQTTAALRSFSYDRSGVLILGVAVVYATVEQGAFVVTNGAAPSGAPVGDASPPRLPVGSASAPQCLTIETPTSSVCRC
jgi:hypothetical protein